MVAESGGKATTGSEWGGDAAALATGGAGVEGGVVTVVVGASGSAASRVVVGGAVTVAGDTRSGGRTDATGSARSPDGPAQPAGSRARTKNATDRFAICWGPPGKAMEIVRMVSARFRSGR
jgi:hypothetical protein